MIRQSFVLHDGAPVPGDLVTKMFNRRRKTNLTGKATLHSQDTRTAAILLLALRSDPKRLCLIGYAIRVDQQFF